MASDAPPTGIRLPLWRWARLLYELRRRGEGRGESGAFLLGREGKTPARVTAFVCYDDLDPDAYQSGAIEFHAAGYAAMWDYCKKRGLEVYADVHTHPGGDVRQSAIDARHPMLPTVGHTAMIVPNYARTAWWSLNKVGVYEYLGSFKWRTHAPSKRRRVELSFW